MRRVPAWNTTSSSESSSGRFTACACDSSAMLCILSSCAPQPHGTAGTRRYGKGGPESDPPPYDSQVPLRYWTVAAFAPTLDTLPVLELLELLELEELEELELEKLDDEELLDELPVACAEVAPLVKV